MNKCCYESISKWTYIRRGRAYYVCDKCDKDITIPLVYMYRAININK